MNEYSIGYLAIGNIVAVAVTCLCYMLGGRANKWIRRYIGSAVLAAAVNVTALLLNTWSAWLLIVWPMTIGMFTRGYSNNSGTGWIKRICIGIISVLIGCFLCWVFDGGWWLLIIHGALCAGTVLFSFKNPLPAAAEEPLVCLLNSTMIVFYPFISIL